MGKVQTFTPTPTINGVIKGRPGKGKVLSLGERRTCYHGHRMSDDNVFTYQGRIWCRRCRAESRKRSKAKRAEAMQLQAKAKRADVKAQLDKALKPKATRKAAKPKTSTPAKAKARKATPKLKGQARIDAELKAFSAKRQRAA